MNSFIHLIPDDPKFVAYIVEYFSAVVPHRHRYVLMGSRSDHYHAYPHLLYHNEEVNKVFELTKDARGVITHGMYGNQVSVINQLSATVPVAWIPFGAEYHDNLPEFKCRLLFKKTESLKYAEVELRSSNRLRRLLRSCRGCLQRMQSSRVRNRQYSAIRQAMQRANVIGLFLEEEFELLRAKLNVSAKWSWFTYYNILDTVGSELIDQNASGNDVLVGNSSDPSNNHVEAIDLLVQHRNHFDRAIVPLSYGDPNYRERILDYGLKQLNDQFAPLTQFVERTEYNRLLLSCKVAIMNHRRQQAVGNVITLLWLGAKVYMTNESTVFQYFKRQGLCVFSIEDDLLGSTDPASAFAGLSIQQVGSNRSRLEQLFSRSAVISGAVNLIDDLERVNS